MRLTAPALATLGALTLPQPAFADPARYALDPSHTTIGFLVDHIGYAKTLGLFTEIEGTFIYDDETNEVSEISVSIPVSSVWTNDDRRDSHVRSADFLDAESHPAITFTAEGGTAETGTTGTVVGDLTVRGVTNPVTLDVTLNKVDEYPFGHQKETLGISIRGTVTRSDYGMTYALGGIVGDEVDLLIEFEAIRED
ncbi:MAG: YceI family protein [Pseudomonadota bacterium]